jgi:hypothetical protein
MRKSQFAQMITLSLLIAACFTLVSPQLALAQHTALMALYDALGVATQRRKRKKQKIIFLFRLSSSVVPALCGDCTVLWHSYDMFREQRDCSVRMEVCLCCGLMLGYRRRRLLSSNQLTGTIPSTVGQLSSLQYL